MKYSAKRAKRICELIADGKHLIDDACEMAGISRATYYHWKKTNSEFLDMIQEAEEIRFGVIGERAISGLYKLVEIYEYDEIKTDYEPAKLGKDDKPGEAPKPVIAGRTITKKKIMPTFKAIEYALNNIRSDKFRTRNQMDHTNNGDSFNFGSFLMQENTVGDDDEDFVKVDGFMPDAVNDEPDED